MKKSIVSFPRYTRAQNRACKLLDKDIVEINRMKASGWKQTDIAIKFNITPQAVHYWCLSDKARKNKNKRAGAKALVRKRLNLDKQRERDRDNKRIKRIVMEESLVNYELDKYGNNRDKILQQHKDIYNKKKALLQVA